MSEEIREYEEVNDDEIEKMLKLEAYQKALGQLRDLMPQKIEDLKDIKDLEGWLEEVNWLLEGLDEIC